MTAPNSMTDETSAAGPQDQPQQSASDVPRVIFASRLRVVCAFKQSGYRVADDEAPERRMDVEEAQTRDGHDECHQGPQGESGGEGGYKGLLESAQHRYAAQGQDEFFGRGEHEAGEGGGQEGADYGEDAVDHGSCVLALPASRGRHQGVRWPGHAC